MGKLSLETRFAASISLLSPVIIILLMLHVVPFTTDTVSTSAVTQWLRCSATIRKVARSIPAGVSVHFSDIKSFRSHYGPGVDSVSNRNEYQKYFLGGKGGRCVRLTTYHHPVPLSRNLGTLNSWNPLGLSRPVMGADLPLPFTVST